MKEHGSTTSGEDRHYKVLLLAYTCDPDKGSESGNSWQWAWNLASQGNEVWVLTHGSEGHDAVLRDRAGLKNLHFINVPIANWITSTRGQAAAYLRYVAWQRAALQWARDLHAKVSFDVAHHVSWGSLLWGSPLSRLPIPYIFGPVGGGQVAPRGYRRYLGRRWFKELLRSGVVRWVLPINPLTRRTAKAAHLVLAANTETLQLVERLGSSRGHLTADTAIPPGYADGASLRTLSNGETLRIVWVGRLFPIKGLRLALEALSSTLDVPWHLTIVGGGRLGPKVPEWLAELEIENRVDWLGQIGWQEVKKAYSQAHIMLFSSLRDSMGAQLFEALGIGLPVIALNHHGARDMLPGNASIKADVGTPEETIRNLSNAIRHVGKYPETVGEMSQAALEFAAANTWEDKARQTYRLLQLP